MINIRIPTSTPDLPLLRTRLALLVLTHIFFTVAGSLCLKIFTKHRDVQHRINDAAPDGVKVQLEYNDIKAVTIVLFISTHFGTAFLSKILIFHLQDIYGFIPLAIARKLRIVDKRLASSTLGYQTIALAVLIVFNSVTMGFFTSFTFTRDQVVNVETAENVRLPETFGMELIKRLGIPLPYRTNEYIRRAAVVPWIAILWALPTLVVTAIAWRRRRPNPPAPRSPSPEMSTGPIRPEDSLDEKTAQVEMITLESV